MTGTLMRRVLASALLAAAAQAQPVAVARLAGPPQPDQSFALGIEYTETGLASAFQPTGVLWAKTRLEAFEWGAVEPAPPASGVHTYDWTCTDALVAEYQQAGGALLQSYVSPRSVWGSVSVTPLLSLDIMPKPQYMADYAAFIAALVERYDGDGNADMPGLRTPVRHWVVGGEWSGFWPSGSHTDYLTLLQVTRSEARRVFPAVRIGLIPLLLWDVFEGNEPSAATIAQRLAGTPPWRNATVGIAALLDNPALFDYVDVHSLGDATELPPLLRWLRGEMIGRGYRKPIWIDDAFPMGILSNLPNQVWTYPTIYPVDPARQAATWAVVQALADPAAPAFAQAAAWVAAEAAKGTVKKIVTAYGEGAAGIHIGNTEDWMHDTIPVLRQTTLNLVGCAAAFGMLDVTHPGGYQVCAPRTPGVRRPAWYATQLAVQHLGPFDFDRILRYGGTLGARGYRLDRNGVPLWVLWDEDGVLELPGDPPERTLAEVLGVPAGFSRLRVTETITQMGVTTPRVTRVPVVAGRATVTLDSTPRFILGEP